MTDDRASGAGRPDPRRLRLALGLVLAGLALELPSVVAVTPATFILFAAVGLPLVGGGIALYLSVVARVLRRKGAL